RVVATGNEDEIAELGRAFNTMAGQVEEQHGAVQGRERRLAALVENASDGIMVIGAGGGIDFVTPSLRQYIAEDGLAATGLAEIVHPDDLQRIRAAWNRVLVGGEGSTLEV